MCLSCNHSHPRLRLELLSQALLQAHQVHLLLLDLRHLPPHLGHLLLEAALHLVHFLQQAQGESATHKRRAGNAPLSSYPPSPGTPASAWNTWQRPRVCRHDHCYRRNGGGSISEMRPDCLRLHPLQLLQLAHSKPVQLAAAKLCDPHLCNASLRARGGGGGGGGAKHAGRGAATRHRGVHSRGLV
jgi:hypothetical protein